MSDNILSLVGASKRFGDLTVLDNVTIGIDRGEKVGLIGPNGTGKSTLMRLIAGAGTVVGPTPERTEVLDEGTVAIRNDARLFFLEQEPRFPDEATPRELLLACVAPLRAAIARYEDLVVKGDPRADAVLEEIERLGGWDYEHRLERAASEVGLPLDRTVAGMSGGEKKRVALAQMLVSGADFWLLDEPTNHLDAETTEWLEETLSGSTKTVLLVTHDRYFLDRVADRMLSLRRGEMRAYDGNYSDYLEARAIEDSLEGRARDRRERLFLAELDWARRMPKARTTKSRFRMDRVGELEASLKIVPDRAAIGFSFGDPPRLGKTILETVSIYKGYGDRELIHGLSLTLRRGERIGIVGRNGCGKSTLLRMMAGDIAPDRGTVTRGSNTEIAWLDQYRLRHLDLTKTVRATVVPEGGDTVFFGEEKIHVASWLDRFGFPSKTHLMKVSSLSGGERNRLAIARFLLEKANLLLLDEPTNDLDLDTLNLLEAALVEFPGCVIVVTHDRYFLDKVSTGILAFDGKAEPTLVQGDYTHYRRTQTVATEQADAQKAAARAAERAAAPAKVAVKSGLSSSEKRELAGMEAAIEAGEGRVAAFEATLGDPDTWNDRPRAAAVERDLAAARTDVERLYARWEALMARAGGQG